MITRWSYPNGSVADQDPEPDHEFAYWNREIDLPIKALETWERTSSRSSCGNKPQSSDLYMDVELTALIPIPRPPRKVAAPAVAAKDAPKTPVVPAEEPRDPTALQIDKAKKTVTVNGVGWRVRKLPHLGRGSTRSKSSAPTPIPAGRRLTKPC